MNEEPRAKEILDFWEAFDKVDPVGEEWMQTATMCQELSLMRSSILATHGGKLEPRKYTEFLPARHIDSPPPPVDTKDLPDESPDEIHNKFVAEMGMRAKWQQ